MSINPYAYNITIRHDNFEGEDLFEARVKELPDISGYAETYGEAYDLAVDAIQTAAEAFSEKGRAFPPPAIPVEDYSGRVTLRLPRSLHRSLAEAAESESVSLNQYLVASLSYFTGLTKWLTVETKHKAKVSSSSHLKLVKCQELQLANSSTGWH